LRKLKNDLLNVNGEEFTSPETEHEWVTTSKSIDLPNKKEFQENLIYYDIQCSPNDYLLPMYRMMKSIENSDIPDKPKLKNFLPSRSTLIPKHIRIDTTTMILLFKFKTTTDLKEEKHMVWNEYFRVNRNCFKMKGYKFNNSIVTDGVSCSLLFIREDQYGKRCPKGKKKVIVKETYFNELSSEDLEKMKKRRIVGIDPNMGNLLYCSGEKNDKFRYTQGQRKVEMKTEKYKKRLQEKQNEIIHQEETVKTLEETLSKFDSKTLKIENYIEYLKQRFKVDKQLGNFYQEKQIRKDSLHSYRNRINSEYRLVKNMKEIYGNDAILCIGDWEQSQHRKYKEPVKGKGFRILLRRFGFDVYLIDEFRTSLQCWNCKKEEGKMENCYYRTFTKKDGSTESKKIHGLLKCKTCDRTCNRDANSSRNIRDIGQSILDGTERPKYLQRKH
jgi:hypothetical protein